MLRRINIRSYEKGLCFRDGEFAGLMGEGRHWIFDPLCRKQVDTVSMRAPWLVHEKLDLMVKSGALAECAVVLDLKDNQRALVWIEGRFKRVLPAGLYALWNTVREVKVELVDVARPRFEHGELDAILRSTDVEAVLKPETVALGHGALVFHNGRLVETLGPGRYAFWKGAGSVALVHVDMRECLLDVSGQEIMTSDKVTLRLNALVTYRVKEIEKAVSATEDVRQALYREAQLVLRAVIGGRDLDALLADKEAVTRELVEAIRARAQGFGLEVTGLGIRDIILPGEMKELLNKVTEAKKAMEAVLITRREETAAMRSQANTAKLLESNPTLMRLKELEVLEKVAGTSKINVVLGDKGLANRVVNLL